MSELVERHMESMAEEIEEMRRTKLFSIEETRAILRKRKQFEYKVNGVTKNVKDFKDYIQYEKILLRDIRVRRNKYRVADRKSSIEFKILKRIKYLYEIAFQRFSDDFSLCLAYFKFCKESNNYNKAASLVIQNMIKNFSHNPEVWQVAAAWYIGTDLNQALNVIHKGLMIHKDCKLLYSEAIELELLNRKKGEWSKEMDASKSKDELCCEKIKTYIQSIFNNINDFKFLLEIVKQLEPHPFTASVQNEIIQRLLEYYVNEELVWHTLAQRERNGHHYEASEEVTKSTKFCLNKCFEKYREGLSKISEAKKPALWALYLDCLVELQQQNDVANMIKKNTLKMALEEASNEIVLDEKYFIVWTKLTDNEAETIKVLEKGISEKFCPNSVELWKLRLKSAIIKDRVKEIDEVFHRAILKLKEKSAPVWMMTLRYHTLTSSNQVLKMIYEAGTKQPKEISDKLKPEYIQWLSLCEGISEARKAYQLLATQKPYCKELHTAMLKIESLEIEEDVDEMESILNSVCEQFGQEDVDVWIHFCEFYLTHRKSYENKNPSVNIKDKILQLYRKAESTLKYCNDGLLLTHIKEKFDTITNSADI